MKSPPLRQGDGTGKSEGGGSHNERWRKGGCDLSDGNEGQRQIEAADRANKGIGKLLTAESREPSGRQQHYQRPDAAAY